MLSVTPMTELQPYVTDLVNVALSQRITVDELLESVKREYTRPRASVLALRTREQHISGTMLALANSNKRARVTESEAAGSE